MFPLYSETRKKDVVTDNYLYPFFHRAARRRLARLAVLAAGRQRAQGRDHADQRLRRRRTPSAATTIFLRSGRFISSRTPASARTTRKNSAPRFRCLTMTRSPKRDSTTVLWPFFTWIDDREKKYREWQGPWPFVIFARGEGKTTVARLAAVQPVAQPDAGKRFLSLAALPPQGIARRPAGSNAATACCFIFTQHVTEKNTQTGAEKKRVDMWPFFTWHRDFNGNERLQILAPLEPAVPDNRGIERNWSPLWSLWRAENNRPNRRGQPVAAVESLPPRHRARREKMLAPVRPFPVSI